MGFIWTEMKLFLILFIHSICAQEDFGNTLMYRMGKMFGPQKESGEINRLFDFGKVSGEKNLFSNRPLALSPPSDSPYVVNDDDRSSMNTVLHSRVRDPYSMQDPIGGSQNNIDSLRSGATFEKILETTIGDNPWSRMAGSLLDTIVSKPPEEAHHERPPEELFKKTWYGEALGTLMGEEPTTSPPIREFRRAPARNENFGLSSFLDPSLFQTPPTTSPAPIREAPPLINPLELFTNPLQTLLGKPRNEERVLETGRGSFDRFVVHENEDGGGLLSNRWNKKGLQWTDGNLRLVNMKGNDFLGSEIAVHDRSIDIPVQSWFDVASQLLSKQSENSDKGNGKGLFDFRL